MQRIVKRFLLHKQRESDDVKENNFEELKQDLQMVRFEMLNDIKKSEEETLKYISLIHNGVAIIGEEMLKDVDDAVISSKFKEFKQYEYELRDSIETIDNDSERTPLEENVRGLELDKYHAKHSLPNLVFTDHSSKIKCAESNQVPNEIIQQKVSHSKSEPNLANHGVTPFNLEQVSKHTISELEIINEEDETF